MTQPMKKGTSSYPNILFSYPRTENFKVKRPLTVKPVSRGNKFNQPFKPANTALNGFFYSDRKQYGEDEKNVLKEMDHMRRAKTAGRPKYKKNEKEFYAKHLRDFVPASFSKKGEKGYFSTRYGVPFVPYIPLKRKKVDKEEFSQPFK